MNKVKDFGPQFSILKSICNPGLKDRHWKYISEKVGFELKPEGLTLQKCIDRNLLNYTNVLEIISKTASKEF